MAGPCRPEEQRGMAVKTPLRYQLSEYDCGPTAMLNAVSYLFEREEIPPEVIRNIMLYCLDCYGDDGVSGKSGTSCAAMMFLSNWLNGFGKVGRLPISSQYLFGEQVRIGSGSQICDALRQGGVAVVRLFLDEWHYVSLTGWEEGKVYLFDPYFIQGTFDQKEIEIVSDHPFQYNRIIPQSFFDREELELYALGPASTREAVVLFNEKTRLTAEKTIEYFI